MTIEKNKLYTFKLPISLIKEIDKLTINRAEFIIAALKTALNPESHVFLPNAIDKDNIKNMTHANCEYLDRYIGQLEDEIEFWKDKYEVLQLEYYDQVRDSIKRLDSKFERIMYSIDESKSPKFYETLSVSPELHSKKQNQKKIKIRSLFNLIKGKHN